jgi:tetratricopeptide (TPR) repeat protein
MSGRKVISAYTPSNTDRGILKRIFVQREKLLERIVDRLSRSMTTGDKHQILLVGPRGCGKTHLVSLAVCELQSKEALRDQMRIAWLGEVDSFTGLVHLAFGIARQLALEYPDEFPADFRTSVRGLSQDDAALVVLQSTIRHLGKRHLLLVTENMDQTFESLGDSGRKKWRAFLQETRKIATLATAQQLFAAVSDRKEAFFGFFDIQHLEPLSVDDAAELMARISREQAKPDLASYLNSAEGRFRVRALHHLAGGNHRMYVLLAEFLTKDSLEDLVAAFESLANDMTPYFQERVRSLPDQQRQLVQCLCDADGAMTVKEIAGETFIDERTCSKQLGNLKAKGYVRSEKRGKESWYDMAEPLMRLCLEIKNQRGRPLRLVAKFLRAWFPPAALQAAAVTDESSRVKEYCVVAMESAGSLFDTVVANLISQIQDHIGSGKLTIATELAEELQYRDPVAAQFALGHIAYREGRYACSTELLTDITQRPDLNAGQKNRAVLMRAAALAQQGDDAGAMEDCTRVIQCGDLSVDLRAVALNLRGMVYRMYGHVEQAIADHTAVIEMHGAPAVHRAEAFYNRGIGYRQRGDAGRALADFTTVIELPDAPAEQKVRALVDRGLMAYDRGDTESASADCTKVIETLHAPTDQRAWALIIRGVVYDSRGKAAMAEADYTAVIELGGAPTEQKAGALVRRACVCWRGRRFRECRTDLENVLSLPSISPDIRNAALFGVVDAMVDSCSLDDFRTALTRAFVEGDSEAAGYGGKPEDLLWMVLRRSPFEWAALASEIAVLFIRHKIADKLGRGVTQSIQYLDEGDFSASQIDTWNSAWQQAGKGCEDLVISLRCLDAAVGVMKSRPRSDRALFRLPLEIRELVRPLLQRSLFAGTPPANSRVHPPAVPTASTAGPFIPTQ